MAWQISHFVHVLVWDQIMILKWWHGHGLKRYCHQVQARAMSFLASAMVVEWSYW